MNLPGHGHCSAGAWAAPVLTEHVGVQGGAEKAF